MYYLYIRTSAYPFRRCLHASDCGEVHRVEVYYIVYTYRVIHDNRAQTIFRRCSYSDF